MILHPPSERRHRDGRLSRLSIWLVAATLASTLAPAQQIEWVRQFDAGGASTTAWVADVKVAGGFVYVAGTFAAFPVIDGFVRKLDASGNLLWTRQFGTSEYDEVTVLLVQGSEVIVAGVTTGEFPGQADHTPFVADVFVRRYDTDGNEGSTIQIPRLSTSPNGSPNAAFIDASGIYGTDTVGDPEDVQVFKYDHAGNLLWSAQFGTTESDQAGSGWPRSLSVDSTGVCVTGSTLGAFPGQSLSGYEDAFVAKLDLAGNLLWARQFGAPDNFAWGAGVVAQGGGVYVSGGTTTFFDPPDLFISRYDSSGNLLWTQEFGTADVEVLFAGIAADATGVFLAGGIVGAFPGFVSAGTQDVFVRKYDPSGNEVWTAQLGSAHPDDAYAVCLSGPAVFVGGTSRGAMPTQNAASGPFVVKLGPPPVTDTDQDGLSDSEEIARGTSPTNPDTDADGLLDGAEVIAAAGGSCPNPLDPDSDGDGLQDGAETHEVGTSPCLADTDGDQLPDGLDPYPLLPGLTNDVIVLILVKFAILTQALPPALFVGPNVTAKKAARLDIAVRFGVSALLAHFGNLQACRATLQTVLTKIDGNPNPQDKMLGSPQKTDMASAVSLLISLMGG